MFGQKSKFAAAVWPKFEMKIAGENWKQKQATP
jgi:hypothetical protein